MNGLFRLAIALALVCMAAVTQPRLSEAAEYAVGLTPARFPRPNERDIIQMFRLAQEVGTIGVINVRWAEADAARTADQMSRVATQFGLKTLIQLDLFEPGSTRLAPPSGVSASRFDQSFSDAYVATVRQLAQQKPDYLVIGSDINRLLAGGVERLVGFAPIYKRAYEAAKRVSPDTKVTLGFSWDIFRNATTQNGVPLADLKRLVDQFRPALDLLLFGSDPSDQNNSPRAIPDDFFIGIRTLAAGEPIGLQVGWPSEKGGQEAQAAFVDRIPALTNNLSPALIVWTILHDLPFPGPVGTLGLYTVDGTAKAAAARFRALSHPATRTAVDDSTAGGSQTRAPAPKPEPSRRDPSDKYTIWMSALSGRDPVLVASDPKREINHARVSPDQRRFVFTRYNVAGRNGDAQETDSYFKTEAIICRIDGSNCEVVLHARGGILNANAYWTPDGQHLVYVTNDNPSGLPAPAILDLQSREIRHISNPQGLAQADPHIAGDLMVSPGRPARGAKYSVLRLYDLRTGLWRQLTSPNMPGPEMEPLLGDHDPKLSSDGRYVATMRHLAKDDWAIVVVDLATGAERNLSGPQPVDAVPEWSSDGRLIVFWHVDRADLKQSGLYTMTPTGADRRRVPLPHGSFYTMPAFFPGDGSGPEARIIYSAKPEPRM